MRARKGPASRKRRKKILKMAKGYWGGKHRLYKTAHETVNKGLMYASRDRRTKKRNMRRLWTVRINAACENHQLSYSQFLAGLKKAKIELNRKMLAEIAATDAKTFTYLVKAVQGKGKSKAKA